MAQHNRLGQWGENIATEHLIREGYAIVERNWRMEHFEIDIIATKGPRIIFVEVKTRTSADYDPLEAVDTRKKARMIASANAYILSRNLPHEVQYDIITIVGEPNDYTLEHIPDAFWPSVRTRR
ncbi:MAG: YraN family protein [Muribaculaceae bacterium]|nr:YraN family protein [Muribaculaceae bacterium]